jgi:outer membrane protein assembly factor BamA
MLSHIALLTAAFSLVCHLTTVVMTYPPPIHLADGQPQKSQTESERSEFIKEADENQYTVRRVEFMGNDHTRHDVLARQIMFQEGDTFTRKALEQSLENLSRLKIIKPVQLHDVDVRLDREEKQIDLNILVREKRRSR